MIGELPTRRDIERAADRIAARVRRTPTMSLREGDLGPAVVLKLELFQHTGSFKPRGAFNRVLSAGPLPAAGLIAASGGNHGAAVAHVASALGLRAEIFVPTSTPQVKIDRLSAHGPSVTVTVTGDYYADAHEAHLLRAEVTGAFVVHPYDHPAVLAGQGTVACELEADAPDLDTVLVACGGGGLVGGMACWFDGRVRVVAVEPERSCALAAALDAGEPVDVDVSGVAADSLGARRIGDFPFAAASRAVDRVVLVADEEILAARDLLWDRLRLATEPGGAAAFAALASGRYRPEPDERLAVVVCGSNTDPATLGR